MTDEQIQKMTPRQRAFLESHPDAEMTNFEESDSVAEQTSDGFEPTGQKGIGGLLLAFIFLLGLGAIVRLSGAFSQLDMAEVNDPTLIGLVKWESYKTNVQIVALIDFFVSIATGVILIWVRKPLAVYTAISTIWLLGPARALLAFKIFEAPGNLMEALVLSCMIPVIWTAYLLRSHRVKLTYFASEPK
jgi:hypothetical protein